MDNIHAIRYLKSFRFVCSSEVLLLFFLRFEDRITHILFISSIIAIEEKLKELTRLLQNSTGEVESEGELDERVEANFEMHQSLAQICRTQRQPAKRVEKMLEKQFAPYKNEFERLDAQKISAIIEGRTENTVTNAPIPALIWFAVRNVEHDKELETRIFTAIHMKEHLALRFYDELSLKLPGSKVEVITTDKIRLLHDLEE
jgi:hypothetical protein